MYPWPYYFCVNIRNFKVKTSSNNIQFKFSYHLTHLLNFFSNNSSALNSISAILWSDVLQARCSKISERNKAMINKVIVTVCGVISIVLGILFSYLKGTLIKSTISFLSLFWLPICSFPLAGAFFPFVSSKVRYIGERRCQTVFN